MDTTCRREQGGVARRDAGQMFFGQLDLALLVEVRRNNPLVQGQGMAGGLEDGAAVDDAECAVHAESETFEHGGEVPGVDRLSIDCGLAAHRVEAVDLP